MKTVWYSILANLILVSLFLMSCKVDQSKTKSYDVVVYGSTPPGIIAAIIATRENARVIVIGPGKRIGGMVTGGLCRTDFGDSSSIGGLSIEYFGLYKSIGKVDEWYNEPRIFQKAYFEMDYRSWFES